MRIVVDTHTHTIACNHAYCTITELAQEAAKKGLEILCITEHGPQLPGGPHKYFFGNIRVVPEEINGVKILKGIEANIIDYNGNLDIPKEYINRLDIILAGLHDICLVPGTIKQNTNAVIGAMRNPIVDVITHIGNPKYELDYDKILKVAIETNTLIEINNSSFIHTRKGSENNCLYVAKRCKELGIHITLGSDAHFSVDVGNFNKALEILNEVNFPEELIMNNKSEKIINYLKNKKREIYSV